MHPYPTLCLLDCARGADHRRFTDDPDALALERRARQLVADYWSDSVWLTGLVSEVSFTTVCEALERERSTSDAEVVVLMTTVPAALKVSHPPQAAIEVIAAP
jgi:hypothetical protein